MMVLAVYLTSVIIDLFPAKCVLLEKLLELRLIDSMRIILNDADHLEIFGSIAGV